MDGFATLELHADVASGVDRLHEDGFRLVTLSNGAASVADRLLTAATSGTGSSGCSRSRTPAPGSRPPGPTSTPRRSAT